MSMGDWAEEPKLKPATINELVLALDAAGLGFYLRERAILISNEAKFARWRRKVEQEKAQRPTIKT